MDLQLCRLYQCVPGALDDQDTDRMMEHLMIVGVESEIANKRARKHG